MVGKGKDHSRQSEVENRHAAGMGSMGREDPVSNAADQALDIDTGGAGSDNSVIPEAAMNSGSIDIGEKEHAQDEERGDDDRKGEGVTV